VFRRFFFFISMAIPGMAQDTRILSYVKGTVVSGEQLSGNHLVVELIESLSEKRLARAYVGADGSFEFRDVAAGVYSVELEASSGEPIQRQTVTLRFNGDQIEIRLPAPESNAARSGTVSVRELQHPLSPKSRKKFDAAEKASAGGDHLKAVEILRGTLSDASAAPYARLNIGVAYIKAGQAAAAIPEFEEAARLMPEEAVAHIDLAYALLLTKRYEFAETECERALQLDRNNYKARWVRGTVLLQRGSRDEEAVEDLRFASREIPKAKVVLAEYYERRGQKDAAARELREFLPRASSEDRVTVEKWLSKLMAK